MNVIFRFKKVGNLGDFGGSWAAEGKVGAGGSTQA